MLRVWDNLQECSIHSSKKLIFMLLQKWREFGRTKVLPRDGKSHTVAMLKPNNTEGEGKLGN